MPRVRTFKTSFNSGELTPLAKARSDVSSYSNGAARLVNWRQLLQGGITRRPGMCRKAVLDHAKKYQIEKYIFDNEQEYILIFSEAQLDIYRRSSQNIVDTLTSQPWTLAQIGKLTLSNEGDVIIVTSSDGDLVTTKITRTSATTFTSSAFEFEVNTTGNLKKYIPFEKFADPSVTLAASGTSGTITLTSSADHFVAEHVNKYVRYQGKQVKITAYTNATTVTGTVVETLSGTTANADWDEEVFNEIHGYPRCSIFHDQRLHFGGHKILPRHYFASKVGAFYNFDTGTGADSDAMQGVIAESDIGGIKSMASLRQLQIFADQGEIYIPATEAKPLTPNNLAFKVQSRYGSSVSHVADFDTSTVYITSGGAIREFIFDELQSGFESFGFSFLSRHLIKGAKRIISQLEGFGNQEQYCFVVNEDDGTVAVLLNERSEKITAWSEWATQGSIKDMVALTDSVYAIVEREIDGTTVQWLEEFREECLLDGSITLTSGIEQSVWGGLLSYANEEVHVRSGKFYMGTYTVSPAGQIDLGEAKVKEIEVGYNYTPYAKTLPPELQLGDGPTFGEQRRVVRVVLMVNESYSVKVAENRLIIRDTTDDLTIEPEGFTGKLEFYMRGWDKKGEVEILQEVPLPLTVLGLGVTLEF